MVVGDVDEGKWWFLCWDVGAPASQGCFRLGPRSTVGTEELGWGGRPAGRRQSPRQRGERVSGTWL